MEVGQGSRKYFFLLFYFFFFVLEFQVFHEFCLFFLCVSLASYAKFASLMKSMNFVSFGKPAGSVIAVQGLAVQPDIKVVRNIVWFVLHIRY